VRPSVRALRAVRRVLDSPRPRRAHVLLTDGVASNELGDWRDDRSLPGNTVIPVVLEDRLRTDKLICEKICWPPIAHLECPTGVSDLPPGGDGVCRSATNQFWATYTWDISQCDGCRCSTSECNFALDPSTPVPPDWPCGTDG
jgi:hypothetical protein